MKSINEGSRMQKLLFMTMSGCVRKREMPKANFILVPLIFTLLVIFSAALIA